jgi:hypothetical protein
LYLETQTPLKVHGVGHLTALTFALTLGSKENGSHEVAMWPASGMPAGFCG